MSILIISTSYDDHAQEVENALRVSGQEVLRINLDLINLNEPHLISIRSSEHSAVLSLTGKELHDIRGVFVHHPIVELSSDYGVDELDKTLCRASWTNVLDWIEQSYDTAVWVNKPSVIRTSSSSLRQLMIAEKCGFQIPTTIFTNSIGDLVSFAKKYDGKVIIKPGNLTGLKMNGQRMLARLIDVGTVDEQVLKRAPCLFQFYIEKAYELRIHVIGRQVLACKIYSQHSKKTQIDWRNYDLRNTPHEALELDDTLKEQCRNIVDMLGLQMGILDLVCTPDNEIVFIECNSQGHWIWIEELTGLPITKTLCKFIADA